MKKHVLFPISVLLIVASCQTDTDSTEAKSVSGKTEKDYFENDIITEGLGSKTSKFSVESTLAVSDFSALIDNLDTDGDGLSDYAEDRIKVYARAELRFKQLDKNNPNDVKSLKGTDVISVAKDNGSYSSYLFYKTSYYQNHFCNPPAPTYLRDQLDEREINLLEDTYYKTLKIFRTPEFQEYILTKPAGRELGEVFIQKAKDLKRGVEFRSIPGEPQGAGGSSNLWSYIHVSHWSMAPGSTYVFEVVAHELIHHVGYGHEYDYAYGGGYKSYEMLNQGKHNYDIIDLEQKKFYMHNPNPAESTWSSKDGYVVLHFAKITGSSLNYVMSDDNWTTNAINSNQKLDLSRGTTYNLNIVALNAQKVSIWIDFNDDAVYTNDERVLVNSQCKGGWDNSDLSFIIPDSAKTGKHFMRINSSFYTSNPTAYGPNSRGSSINLYNVTIN